MQGERVRHAHVELLGIQAQEGLQLLAVNDGVLAGASGGRPCDRLADLRALEAFGHDGAGADRWLLRATPQPVEPSGRVAFVDMADLRFGTFLAPCIMPVYEAVTRAVGSRLGLSTELVVETSYESCIEDVNDVCFVCSLPYIMLEREGLSPAVPVAAPVLSEPRYRGRPVYYSDVIVPRESDATAFLDLRGRSWAYNEPLSHSGYGITRFHLLRLGETGGFFGEVIEAGFHEAAIRMVGAGDVDASAIDSQVLSVVLRDEPDLRDSIRIVESLGPSTIQPVAISRRIPSDLASAIVEVLTTLHRDPEVRDQLAEGLVERFVAVGPDSYDDIRHMLDACEAAGFTELR